MFGFDKVKKGKNKENKDGRFGWLSYTKKVDEADRLSQILEEGDKPYPAGTDLEQVVREMLMEEFPQEMLKSSSFELIVNRTVQRLKEQQMKLEDGTI